MKNTKLNLKKIALLFAIIGSNYFAQATKIVVNTSNFQFAPANITIQLGDTVMWQWVSGFHNTTSSVVPGGAVPWAAPLNSGATSFTYVPSKVGTYNYTCTFHSGVMVGSIIVICPPAAVSIVASGPTTFCKGGSVVLSATPSTGTFQWKKNGVNIPLANSSSYTVNATGNFPYTVMYTNACGNTALSNAIQVNVKSNPTITISPSSAILCPPVTSATLNATGGSISYTWSPAASLNQTTGSPVIATPIASTTYTVTGTSANGCTATKTARVTVKPKPVNLSSFNITASGASVKWDTVACAIGYTLQYRVVAGAWTTINITTNTPTRAITGLSMSTVYEWRVRAKYPNATFSAYTSIATFSTLLPKQGLNIVSASNDLHIFPNPATEKLNVEFPFGDDNAVIKIVNSLGQTMMEQNTNVNDEQSVEIKLSQLPTGVYMVAVYNGDKQYLARFIKK